MAENELMETDDELKRMQKLSAKLKKDLLLLPSSVGFPDPDQNPTTVSKIKSAFRSFFSGILSELYGRKWTNGNRRTQTDAKIIGEVKEDSSPTPELPTRQPFPISSDFPISYSRFPSNIHYGWKWATNDEAKDN